MKNLKTLIFSAIMIFGLTTASYAEDIARSDSSPERMFRQLASDIEAGNALSALTHFTPSAENRDVIIRITHLAPDARKEIAASFLSARLEKIQNSTEDGVNYQIFFYEIPMKEDDGRLSARVVSVERMPAVGHTPAGDWHISNW